MSTICAVSCSAPPPIITSPVKDDVTPLKAVTDNAQPNTRPNTESNTEPNKHLLIAAVERYLAAIPRSSLRGLGNELLRESTAIDLMAALQIAEIRISRLCLNVQQSQLKRNSESRNKLNIENIAQMQKAVKEAEISRAAQEKRGYWGKLSNILGMAVAAMGVLLAPFTGGVSLLATAYLAVDLGLQLGEQISGTRMSIDSGLQIACKFVLDNMGNIGLSDAQREFYAGIASAVASFILAVGMTILSGGTAGMPKLLVVVENLSKKMSVLSKLGKSVPRLGMVVQGTSEFFSAGAGVTSGKYGLDNASSELNLNGIDIQREGIQRERQLLMKAFEQCNEKIKEIMEQLQRNSSWASEAISRCAEVSRHAMGSRANRYAA